MEKKIPKEVQIIAEREACNAIDFCGIDDGWEVYGIGEVGEDGSIIPTGLPVLVLWKDGEIKIVSGEDSLRLLSRLE